MLHARELTAKAEQYDKRADATMDPLLALALRQRARQWRDMAAEIDVFQNDPAYRAIHDRPPAERRS
jgi:hypothetical protein